VSPRRKRLKLGQIYAIPIGDARVGFAQVVHVFPKVNYYFAVFASAYPKARQPYHGIGEWDADYDRLRPPPPELTTAALFGSTGPS
jgi:hypothetical protein